MKVVIYPQQLTDLGGGLGVGFARPLQESRAAPDHFCGRVTGEVGEGLIDIHDAGSGFLERFRFRDEHSIAGMVGQLPEQRLRRRLDRG